MADRIGVSEAELIAATGRPALSEGKRVRRLRDDLLGVVKALPSLGQVMALTRNRVAVHEKIGVYGELEGDVQVAGIYGDRIDLRLFLRHWRFGFAFDDFNSDGGAPKRSLQFFDTRGHAVHKVHLRPESDHAAFDRLVAERTTDMWENDLAVAPSPARLSGHEVDVGGLRLAWRELRNVHDVHILLRRFEIERLDALRSIGAEFAFETEQTAH